MTCSNIMVNGSELDLSKKYRIITNSYIAAGGDGYRTFENSSSKEELEVYCGVYLKEYIYQRSGALENPAGGRITIID